MKYEITEEQKQVLMELLGRTQLKGSEVSAFNSVVQALSQPIEEDED